MLESGDNVAKMYDLVDQMLQAVAFSVVLRIGFGEDSARIEHDHLAAETEHRSPREVPQRPACFPFEVPIRRRIYETVPDARKHLGRRRAQTGNLYTLRT